MVSALMYIYLFLFFSFGWVLNFIKLKSPQPLTGKDQTFVVLLLLIVTKKIKMYMTLFFYHILINKLFKYMSLKFESLKMKIDVFMVPRNWVELAVRTIVWHLIGCKLHSKSMADTTKRPGGRYCVAGVPNKTSCTNTTFTPGVRMHQFLSDPVTWHKWVKFIRQHRADFFEPVSKYTSLYSVHFEESCYERQNWNIIEGGKGSIPTRDTMILEQSVVTKRQKRKVRVYSLCFVYIL